MMAKRSISVLPMGLAVVVALSAASGHVAAQGELSQCRSYGSEREYPCRVPGTIIRSERDHLIFARSQDRKERRYDRGLRREGDHRADLVDNLLDLLINK